MAIDNDFFAKNYDSLSGVDIKAIFHNTAVVPLQAVSYAIQREKAPIYTMGHPDPRAFSRGKRGIAGTLIFAVFDKHALVGSGSIFGEAKIFADREEIFPSVTKTGDASTFGATTLTAVGGTPGVAEGDILRETDPADLDGESHGYDQVPATVWYADQIPPFNIILTGANELGLLLTMRIYGVEILNEGYGISIDDLLSEMQMTYVCRAIAPWRRIADPGSGRVGLNPTK
tara:strand:- start:693 stop:1382 length:690 start_codon:yes stop_codon:yes gene_type:complete